MLSAGSLALLCLLAAGLLDFVFKLYSASSRSRGMLIFGIGCVWSVLQLSYVEFSGGTLTFSQATIVFGLIAAVFVTLSNILLLECLGHLPLSMASTIYRLNTIPLVILAFAFLGENLDWIKSAGIGAGLLSVLLLYQPQSANHGQREQARYRLFLYLIIAASCIRALYGVFTKAGIERSGDPNTMMLMAAAGWCIGGLGYAYFRERRVVLTRDKLKYMLVAGSLVFSVVWLLTTALTLGDANVVVPLANMGFVAAFLISIAMKLESLTPKKLLAIASAMVSIILLSYAA